MTNLAAEATRENAGRVMAIVLDGKVISAPVIRSEITSGEIEITGRFTKTEEGYMAAIIGSGILPATFEEIR